MVQQRLHAKDVKTVWFNAWKYDGKEVIWNALLQTIFLKMKSDPPRKGKSSQAFRQRLGQTAAELAKYSARVGTRFIPGGIIREEDVDALLEALKPQAANESFDFIDGFDAEFARLVEDYVGATGYLVIFIDDLDRCLPENAIQVLEALKLYLDKASCVFVVGCEPAVIEEAIKRRYSDNPALSAVEYLEKIIQVPFAVPRMRVRDALVVLADEDLLPGDTQMMERLVRNATKRNPRRVKRFINAFNIALQDAGPIESNDDRLILAKILLTRLCFPQFYRELILNPRLFKTLEHADSDAWTRAGLTELSRDRDLRRFLTNTREVCPGRGAVRRWIRVDSSRQDEDAEEELDTATPREG